MFGIPFAEYSGTNLPWLNDNSLQLRKDCYVNVSEKTLKILNEGILIMDPNKVFREYSLSQEQIKQMCIEYVKTYFEPSDTEALSKYFEENHHKLKFYIDEQGKPNFQYILRDRITRIKIKDA